MKFPETRNVPEWWCRTSSMWGATMGLLSLACSPTTPAEAPPDASQPVERSAAETAPSSTGPGASQPEKPPVDTAPDEVAPASPPPAPKVVFPPPALEPPVEKTAQEGDGQWVPLPQGGQVDGRPILYTTTIHPHSYQKWVYVKFVAIDLTRAELRLVAGTREPENESISREERGGLVPVEDQDRLAAVFNGGFQKGHGNYGMRIGEHLYVKPKDDACTIWLKNPSDVRIGTFESLGLVDSDHLTWRQTPPCLLLDGKPHPLLQHKTLVRRWGGAADGKRDIRRTALGKGDDENVLYFAFADWITADVLTEGLEAAHLLNAAELDINWSFTRFLFFGPEETTSPDGHEEPVGLQVTDTLVEKVEHRKTGYVQKSEPRDFFYILRKPDRQSPVK